MWLYHYIMIWWVYIYIYYVYVGCPCIETSTLSCLLADVGGTCIKEYRWHTILKFIYTQYTSYVRRWTIEVVIFRWTQFWGLHRLNNTQESRDMGHQIFTAPNSGKNQTRSWKTMVKPGSLYYPTQTMHCYFQGIPQNYHGFASFDPPKKLGNFHDHFNCFWG